MQSLPLSPDLQRELQAKYRILEVVGRGGTAIVLRARHLDLDRDVAIKVKTEGQKLDAQDTERFLLEGRIMARLQHPHLVPVFESGATSCELYLVCEFAEGGTLAQRLKKTGPLPLPEILRIVEQVTDGLGALHQHGIIHRDLKPANILLGEDDVIKITDFGLAKTEDRDFRTEDGNRLGTPDYMSPEQILGEPQGPPADFYALGVMTYLMATGQLPFDGVTDYQILNMKLHETAPRPSLVCPELRGGLDRLVGMLLERRPEDRPQDAASVKALLEEVRRPAPRSAGLQTQRSGVPSSKPGSARQPVPSRPAGVAPGKPPSRTMIPPDVTRSLGPAPGRGFPVVGLLVAATLLAVALYFARRGPDGRFGPLRLEIVGNRITLRGTMSGRQPFHLQARTGSGAWQKGAAVEAAGETTLELPVTPSTTEDHCLRLCQGETVLLELWLPYRPAFRSCVDLVHFSLQRMSPGPDSWRAVYAGSGGREPPPVVAKTIPGTFRFDWSPPADWSEVRLVALEGTATVTSVTDGEPRRVDVRWEIDVGFPTLAGLEKAIPRALEEVARKLDPLEQARLKGLIRLKKPGDVTKVRAEMEEGRARTVGIVTQFIGEELEELLGQSRFDAEAERSLTRAWHDESIQWEDRWHHYLWLQQLGILEAWARRWGVDCPLDADRLLRELIPLTRRPYGALDLPHDRTPIGLARMAMSSSAVDMLARNTLGESIGNEQFLKPEASHRPSRLTEFLDAQNWKEVQHIPISGKPGAGRQAATLRLAIWNLSPFFYLTMRFPGWAPGDRIHLANPMNELNPRMENPEKLPVPDNPHSWLNLPLTTMSVELRLPPALIPAPDEVLILEGFELPGALPTELLGVVIVDARWVEDR